MSSPIESLHEKLNAISPLGANAWTAAGRLFLPSRFEVGAHLIKAGEVVTRLFFLTDGLTRFYYVDAKGREFNKSFSGAGQVLSSMSSLVCAEPSPFFVQALAPTAALTMSYLDFLSLAERYPDWAALRTRLLERLVLKRERREAELLQLSATERYRRFLDEHSHIVQSIPNYHIASYLGITEVALSRIRRRLGLTRVNASGTR